MEQGRPARCVELDPFKPTFLKRDAHSLCELQASQPRLEVGSNEAPRRQPSCHLVQVLIGSPLARAGLSKIVRCVRFFLLCPFSRQADRVFLLLPSVHLDTFLQNDGDSIFSPFFSFILFVKYTLCPKNAFYSCCIFSSANNLPAPFINGILKLSTV